VTTDSMVDRPFNKQLFVTLIVFTGDTRLLRSSTDQTRAQLISDIIVTLSGF